MTGRRGWQIAFGMLLVAQFWALYVPRAPSIESGPPLDKAVHFALFAGVTWLGLRAGVPGRWVVWLMVLQAAVSEVVQDRLLPQRGGDLWDFTADLVGIAAGLWLGRSLAGAVADREDADAGDPSAG